MSSASSAAASAPPPLVVAGKSGLLKLVRDGGRTRWVFLDGAPSVAGTAPPKTKKTSKSAPAPAPAPAPAMSFDHGAKYGECVGTLRWSEGDAFPTLPRWPLPSKAAPPVLKGWRDYIEMRLPPDDKGTIRVEPPMIDGLSYPLSLLFALQRLRLTPPQPGPLTILIIGASSKAEERLMRETSYWQELAHFFPSASLELVFVGPEIAPEHHRRRSVHCDGRLVARAFHGTLGDLFRSEPNHNKETTLVVGFNTGFGNASDGMAKGGFSLMTGWLPDLLAILRLGVVAIFTCANDYSDLRGELAIWKTLLHASLILPPARNPFKAATVVRESNDIEVCEWSCSSCFVYALCGTEEDAPPLPPPTDAAALEELKRRLRKMGKTLAQTQTPSAVP